MSQNIPEETMKKVELLWTKVGFVVQLSQMVEFMKLGRGKVVIVFDQFIANLLLIRFRVTP